MDKQTCQNCKYYHRHYTFDGQKSFRIFCGHCALDRVKNKRPHTTACENFIPAPPDENAFVSKEYLSKALLAYIANLELLPKIEDTEDML